MKNITHFLPKAQHGRDEIRLLTSAATILKGVVIVALAFILMLGVGSAEGLSPVKPGDILIADSNGAILKFDSRSGAMTVLASGWPLVRPFAIAVDAEGRVFVTDTGLDAVVRIDPATGAKEIVAYIPGQPFGLVVNDHGDIFVVNGEAILRIDSDTHKITLVADSSGPFIRVPLGIALAPDGNLLVADASRCVVKVDVNNGAQTLITIGQFLVQPVGITLDESGNIWVADSAAHCVIEIDGLDAAQHIISQGGSLQTPVAIAISNDGSILVSDPDCFNLAGGIIEVNPSDGNQTRLLQGQGDYVNPRGFFVVRTGQVNRRK